MSDKLLKRADEALSIESLVESDYQRMTQLVADLAAALRERDAVIFQRNREIHALWERAERAEAERDALRESEAALSESRKWHEGAREVARLLTERAERAEAERDAVQHLFAQQERHRDELLAENDALRALLRDIRAEGRITGNIAVRLIAALKE